MLKLLSTKYSHWRYESELRMLMELLANQKDGDPFFYPFDQDLRLTEVVVGANSTVTRAELDDALGDLASHVSKLKARLAFKTFQVVRQRRADLWE